MDALLWEPRPPGQRAQRAEVLSHRTAQEPQCTGKRKGKRQGNGKGKGKGTSERKGKGNSNGTGNTEKTDEHAPAVLKRPAAVRSAKKEVAYAKMWYKNSGAWGIRERGGQQLCQVQIRGMSKEDSSTFTDKCIQHLNAGTSLADVMAMIVKKKAQYGDKLSGYKGKTQKRAAGRAEPGEVAGEAEKEEPEEDDPAPAELDTDEGESHWDPTEAMDLN